MPLYRVADKPDVMALLQVGDEIKTPEGPGVVVNVTLQLANYDGRVELDPPTITVQLLDGRVDQFCLCQLDFGDPEVNELVGDEFGRLWPPMEATEIPEAYEIAASRK